jgi:8-oxo-dGTP pyrophosphatase MutT (NUDIX family)
MVEHAGTGYIALSRLRLRDYWPRTLERPDAVPAAVLVLLEHVAGAERVILTVRSHEVEHHKGEISFPGGAVHAADADLATTALRETWEEIGVLPDDVEIIGRLDDMVTISNFVVTPFVGVLKRTPYEFVPAAIEVGEVIEPPIVHLLDAANIAWEERDLGGRTTRSPAFYFEGHRIWGATARMLWEFLRLLQGDSEELEAARRGRRT